MLDAHKSVNFISLDRRKALVVGPVLNIWELRKFLCTVVYLIYHKGK